jgi:fatty acid desaturase
MVPATTDDCSNCVTTLRARLMAESGGRHVAYVDTLTPRYWQVWRDIALGYAFLALVIAALGLPQSRAAQLLAVLPGAAAIGYGLAYLQLFLHEAAHYNCAPGRVANDMLCNALVSWQVGTTVARYRPVHFRHHRELGTTRDPERSYFRALTPRFLLETLTGVHALRVFLLRSRGQDDVGGRRSLRPLAAGVAMHALVATAAWALSGWVAVVAWVLGAAGFYPLFATLRQLLEHRADQADPLRDYGQVDHGAVTRLFRPGPLAASFGGAGFARHLLHHWEPQVSYTRLAELERHLAQTSAAALMEARRTTYSRAFADIWRNDRR